MHRPLDLLTDWRRACLATAFAVILVIVPNVLRAQEPATITDIRVIGNQRVEAETVISYMEIGPGERYRSALVDRSLKNLFDTGLFADIAIRRDGGTLIVQVVENPIINRLVFEGNDSKKDEDLREEVQLRPRVVFTRARVQSDVERLVELYRRSGYFGATVEPKVIQLPQNRVDLVFEVTEGEKTGVRRITFLGNQVFSDDDLRDAIATKESRWWKFFVSNDTYDPDRLAFDRAELRKFYLSRGYADFRVVSAVAELTPDREDFFIVFTVEEGVRYRFAEIDVKSEIRALEPEKLKALVETEKGDIYNADEIESTVDALTEAAGEQGYAFVNVRPRVQRNRETRTIKLTYVILEAPRVYVDRISVTGNVRTLDRVIRRQMRLSEGDAFNTSKLKRSEQRIKGLGYFSNVEVNQREGSTPDRTVVDVKVEEQPTGELSLGAGFSSDEDFIAEVGIRERNLLGRGQDLRLSVSASSRRQNASIGFTEPYFMGRPLAAGFDLFLSGTDFQEFAAFDQSTMGGSLRFGFPLTEYTRIQTRYTYRRDTVKNVSPFASRFIRSAEGTFTTSSVGYSFSWSRLDDPTRPRDGFRLVLSQNVAGLGGNVNYIQTQLSYDMYTSLPFLDDWTLKISATEGYILGLGQDVRLNDRFFLGGSQLRGFRVAGVGPRALTGESLGGNLFYTGSLEVFLPLGTAEQYGIDISTFVDVGALAKVDEPAEEILRTGDPRVSVGIGVSWESPAGPLRFDISRIIKKEPFDITETFQFNIGTRF